MMFQLYHTVDLSHYRREPVWQEIKKSKTGCLAIWRAEDYLGIPSKDISFLSTIIHLSWFSTSAVAGLDPGGNGIISILLLNPQARIEATWVMAIQEKGFTKLNYAQHSKLRLHHGLQNSSRNVYLIDGSSWYPAKSPRSSASTVLSGLSMCGSAGLR